MELLDLKKADLDKLLLHASMKRCIPHATMQVADNLLVLCMHIFLTLCALTAHTVCSCLQGQNAASQLRSELSTADRS